MNANDRHARLIRFSAFEVDLNSGELFKQGRKVKLQGQPFELLAALLERPGEVVRREELRQKVWPSGMIVDFDHGLNRAINKAREALGDSAESPQFIETLPRRGYRFIGSIRGDKILGPAPHLASGTGILIGRDAERRQLLELLGAALAGRGSLALIAGEPGIGKTHLTRVILAEAVRRSCFGVTGHSYELEGAPPYVPFIEVLEHCARVAPRESFRFAVGDAAPEIAKLMPELQRLFPGMPLAMQVPPEQQRRLLFNVYGEFVERSARFTPIVAVFEDLHWADEPSLLLLQHLARMVSAIPVLLIGTYRGVEANANRTFTRTLESWRREKAATTFSLRRLGLTGVQEMLTALGGKTSPDSVAATIFNETEGNPFFVEEVFRDLQENGKLLDDAGEWRSGLKSGDLQVPPSIRLVLGQRFERFREETRRILTMAAVIGRSFDVRLIEALEDTASDTALDALDEAERAHLALPDRHERELHYRFVHELVRQTLAEALSPARRQLAREADRAYLCSANTRIMLAVLHLSQCFIAALRSPLCFSRLASFTFPQPRPFSESVSRASAAPLRSTDAYCW